MYVRDALFQVYETGQLSRAKAILAYYIIRADLKFYLFNVTVVLVCQKSMPRQE